ncbi:MAG: TlpA family protein disulfide reductase [Bdellovibrionales bacterium]|jgi:thiol-disulfide isomerase/thioredoxin|nr:TlpA family protein disulfide reductase [Bdellovibrionales bacterium]
MAFMKVLKKHLGNIVLIAVLAFVVVKQGPMYWKMWQKKGQGAPSGEVLALDTRSSLKLPLSQPHVLVFWATWCPPCKVELARLNKMVEAGKIKPDQVLAISVGEEAELVKQVAVEREYRFSVALDPEGRAGAAYGAAVTPTIVLVNADGTIGWMTMGLSPSLELRVASHLSE